jgi:thiamine-phosphate pyrophosphorylase
VKSLRCQPIKSMSHAKFLRILDANFNRAREGLRVAEDIARFCLEDTTLTAHLKRCRHDLTVSFLDFPVAYTKWVAARDASGDIGKKSWIPRRNRKPSLKELMIANLKRSQEAARVLEELAKVIFPKQAPRFQSLRFRLYELEKRSLQKF